MNVLDPLFYYTGAFVWIVGGWAALTLVPVVTLAWGSKPFTWVGNTLFERFKDSDERLTEWAGLSKDEYPANRFTLQGRWQFVVTHNTSVLGRKMRKQWLDAYATFVQKYVPPWCFERVIR